MLNVVRSKKDNAAYQIGRLISYLTLGAVAGLIGSELFSSSMLRAFQLTTSLLIGTFLCWMALRIWRQKPIHFSVIPAFLLVNLQKWSFRQKYISPSLLIGFSSGLLPCGWLHTFVLASIATRSLFQGSLLLFFFWLGTVPALLFSQTALQKIALPRFKTSSRFLAVLLLALGISNLFLKCYPILSTASASDSDPMANCPMHHH